MCCTGDVRTQPDLESESSTWTKTMQSYNQQYRHKNVNQHVLAEEVPKNTNKTQIPWLRSQLSNHVQSVATLQYKHQ